jgi:hypothetical protein
LTKISTTYINIIERGETKNEKENLFGNYIYSFYLILLWRCTGTGAAGTDCTLPFH